MSQTSNNILVTGGAGYIGSHIIEELVKNKNNKIFILDFPLKDLFLLGWISEHEK